MGSDKSSCVAFRAPPQPQTRGPNRGPEGRDQHPGREPASWSASILSPRPAQHAYLGPEVPLSPRWAPHPVHTLPWLPPRTRNGPRVAGGHSAGVSAHPGSLGLCPGRRQQQQQQQQQGRPGRGAGAGDPGPAPHGSSWAGVGSSGPREQGDGQGRLQMINSGCLPCREARTSAVSAARLTLPGPVVPSRLRHAVPGPDRVLQAQHRRLLQEVFQDDVEGRGLGPPIPASGPHPARGLAAVYLRALPSRAAVRAGPFGGPHGHQEARRRGARAHWAETGGHGPGQGPPPPSSTALPSVPSQGEPGVGPPV